MSRKVDGGPVEYVVRITWRVRPDQVARLGRMVSRPSALPPGTPVTFSSSSRGPSSATFPVRAASRFRAAETAVELAQLASGLRPCDVEVLSPLE